MVDGEEQGKKEREREDGTVDKVGGYGTSKAK